MLRHSIESIIGRGATSPSISPPPVLSRMDNLDDTDSSASEINEMEKTSSFPIQKNFYKILSQAVAYNARFKG